MQNSIIISIILRDRETHRGHKRQAGRQARHWEEENDDPF